MPSTAPTRSLPNILITGTPGSGKTTLAELLAISLPGFTHTEIGKLVKEKNLTDGWDDEYECHVLDEDKLLDELEPTLGSSSGGHVLDYHGCDFFPERWFDLVIVLTVDNSVLYSRLESRGYSTKKLQDNVQCEIMRVIAEEAYNSYEPAIILELESNSTQQLEENVLRIESWVQEFMTRRNA